ncbi:MAG: ABC transporter transmembrane domain-containing protein [Alphaproteobacteria bacterium]|nr:ABC transporter transmembrane domain-containing protein [Rhodospirillales bacterium]MCW9045419.1 ABC transporter transmembrane domain-containing protein [Alphaproteobacteria bacterium]
MTEEKRKKKVDWVGRLGVAARLPWNMSDMVISSFFINVLSLALPITLLQVYDRILPNSGRSTLFLLVSGVVLALLLEMILRLVRSYTSGWISARFEHIAGCFSIERLLSTNLANFEKDGAGVHMERLSALGTLKDFYAGQAILTFFDLPFAVVFLAVIAYLAGPLVFVPITLITLFALSAYVVGRYLKSSLQERMGADDRRFNFIIEVLGGIHTVKALAMETQMLRRYEKLQEGCAEAEYNVAQHSSSAMSVGALFSQLSLFCVVGFGSLFVINGELTVGGLAACTLLAGRAMQPLQRAVGIWARFQSISLARDRVQTIFANEVETSETLANLEKFSGNVELKDVHFAYDHTEEGEILKGIDLEVGQGESVGITGGNASGKSTLLYTIMGILLPDKGDVILDGVSTKEINTRSLEGQIAYLPQHGVLFNGTIMENITMFRDGMVDEAKEIANILGLDSVIAHMPLGYETKVGDGATDALPRGIKQRIAIARALLDRPQVVLMDEANSAMDSAGDAILRDVLVRLKGHRTLIMVTPRPSMLNLCDRVYNLEEGRLVPRVEKQTPPKSSQAQVKSA